MTPRARVSSILTRGAQGRELRADQIECFLELQELHTDLVSPWCSHPKRSYQTHLPSDQVRTTKRPQRRKTTSCWLGPHPELPRPG